MRAPTTSQRLADRRALEAAVADALGVVPAAGDEAWALVQEIAGFEVALSAQLLRLPMQVVEAAAAQLGGDVGPACPAIGVVVVQPKVAGTLGSTVEGDHTRFVVPRTEQRGPVVFIPVEPPVSVAPLRFTGWYERAASGLVAAATGEAGPVWQRPPLARSSVFDREELHFRVPTDDVEELTRRFRRAIIGLRQVGVGWLRLEVRTLEGGARQGARAGSVEVTVQLDPLGAFAFARSGVLRAAWAQLDGLPWRPILHSLARASDVAPPTLRLVDASTVELVGVPAGAAAGDLVQPEASPAPRGLADAVWSTLERLVVGLPDTPPACTRALPGDPSGWIEGLVRAGKWDARGDGTTLLVIEAPTPTTRIRVGLAFAGVRGEGGKPFPDLQVWVTDGQRGAPTAAKARLAWALRLPAEAGELHTVGAWDIDGDVPASRFIVSVRGEAPLTVLLNVLLVLNAPRVTDGRRVRKQGLDAETVALRGGDLISRRTLGALRDRDPSGLAVLGGFPLARISLGEVGGDGPSAVEETATPLDEAAATITLPGLGGGAGAGFPPGAPVTLHWYRRTDGADGVVPAGAIIAVEQDPRERTLISAVHQPFRTVGGRDRDSTSGVALRVLRPLTAAPVLPQEVALTILTQLGPRADGWLCRVRPIGERIAGTTWTWAQLGEPTGSEERLPQVEVGGSGVTPGSRRLDVALGPPDRALSAAELADIGLALNAWFRDYRSRYPTIRVLRLSPLVPLVLQPQRPLNERLALPAERLDTLAPADRLIGPGELTRRPRGPGLLWDAQIVQIREPRSAGEWPRAELAEWLTAALDAEEPGWMVDFWDLPRRGAAPAVSWWTAREPDPHARRVIATAWARPAAMLAASAAAGPVVSLGRLDGSTSPADLERLRPRVEAWWARVGRRCGRSEPALRVLARHPLTRSTTSGRLCDPWGGEREAAPVPFFDAWEVGASPSAAGRPLALLALERELERALRERGWPWRGRIWLPRALSDPCARFWETLTTPSPPPAPDIALVAVGPITGPLLPRELDAVRHIGQAFLHSRRESLLGVRQVHILGQRSLTAVLDGPWEGEPVPASALGHTRGLLQEIGGPGAQRIPVGIHLVDAAVTSIRPKRTR